jgi:hypothetical protein
MDYSLLALIGLVAVTGVLATRLHARSWPGRPGYEYQRVITAAAAGLWFTIAGAIGWELKDSHGWFRGTEWVDGPVWWQLGLGVGLLLLAGFWARRVPPRPAAR